MKFDRVLFAEIGKQLKEARIKKGMSLQDMSDAIGGLKTKQTIMRHEDGTTRIDTETMEAICNVLGLDMEAVVYIAKLNQLEKAYMSVGTAVPYPVVTAKAKVIPIDGKPTQQIQDAYDKADEKTQRAVRILLGLE